MKFSRRLNIGRRRLIVLFCAYGGNYLAGPVRRPMAKAHKTDTETCINLAKEATMTENGRPRCDVNWLASSPCTPRFFAPLHLCSPSPWPDPADDRGGCWRAVGAHSCVLRDASERTDFAPFHHRLSVFYFVDSPPRSRKTHRRSTCPAITCRDLCQRSKSAERPLSLGHDAGRAFGVTR